MHFMYFMLGCWMQAHMFQNKQNLLVKNLNLQQLEHAKNLHFLHCLSNNKIKEIDQKWCYV